MPAEIGEKTMRYQRLLREALADVTIAPSISPELRHIADEYLEMARSYYQDGSHFLDTSDPVNALVCFSYGHAWLDAGVRLGVFKITKTELFAA
jgi:uncharacterized protein